eukprot:2385416-Lingulodinium_polyedra.AAC.1
MAAGGGADSPCQPGSPASGGRPEAGEAAFTAALGKAPPELLAALERAGLVGAGRLATLSDLDLASEL